MGYLNSIKAGALETWKVYKILPSVVGAQGALESGWGTSRLAKPPYNNQFGIKPGGDWTGKTITMPTREYVNGAWITVNEPFRWYDDPGESIRDHGAFFTSTEWRRNNYKAVVGETDYKKACWALQNAPAPYATDPGYAQKLINLIETHNLQAWDREAMAGNSNTVATQTQQTVVSKIVGRELSSAGRTYVKDLNVTMIGDSLGVGTKPHFESLVPKANYDVLGSRQITHATNSLNGTYILQQLKNAGNLKEYVVVILGTNRGVTEQEINNFVNIAGSDRKVIFVDTASEVGHSNTVSVHYENSAKRLSNVYYANWKSTAIPLRPQYYSRDGANGEYIHMTPTGYRKHAEFIAQALYEVATTNFTDRAAEATKTEFYDIKDLELNEDGLITYDVLESNSDGTSTKKKATKQTNIKGLYSPYGDSSIYNPKANRMYGFGSSVNNSNWRESYFEDNEIEDSVRLLEMASAELLERQEPEMIYTVNLLEIPVELSIGDTGIFVDHEFSPPLYLQARVLSLTTSETNPSLNRVTIGNVTELEPQDKSALMAIRAELQETRKDLESNWIGSISTNMTVVSTNGYVLGDRTRETSLVARILKGKEDITNQYDNFTWERISEDETKDTAYNDPLANSVQSSVLTVYEADIIGNQSKFVARAFNAKDELVSHQEIVLKRVETALWTDTDTAPPYAIDGATWTKPDGTQWVLVDGVWEEKVNQAQMFTVKADIDAAKVIADNAKAEADDARQRAEDALTEAGISTDLAQTAKDLAQLAEDNAETALTNAQTAINEAGIAASQAVQAINTADTAKTNAKTALTNAQTALTEAGSAKTTANNLSIKVGEVEAELELKASQTTVDGLSGTVSNHSTTLTQHANQITSKADSSFVNTIKGTVDTHTTEIAQNATEIASKASSSSVNTLTGRVDTAETTLTQHANQISARLTQAQVDDLVGIKGYSTVDYVDTEITATAQGITAELNRVEGLAIKNKFPDRHFKNGLGGWISDHEDVTIMHGDGNMRIVALNTTSSGKRIYNAMDGFENGRVFHFSFTLSGLSNGIIRVGQGGANGETIEFQRINGSVNCTGTFKSNGYALSIFFPDIGTMEIRNMLIYETSGVTSVDMTRINARADGFDISITNLNNILVNDYASKSYTNTQINAKAGEIYQSLNAIEGRLDLNLLDLTRLANESTVNANNPNVLNYVYQGKPNTQYTLSTSVPIRGGSSYDLFFDPSSLNPSSSLNGVGEGKHRTVTTDSTGTLYIGFRPDTAQSIYTRMQDILGGRYWIILSEGAGAKDFADGFASVKINELEQTVDGWRNTITYVDSNQSKINETIATVDSYKQTIGTNGEKIAQLVMSDSIFQTAIADYSRAKQLLPNGNFNEDTSDWTFDGNSSMWYDSVNKYLRINYANIDGESRVYAGFSLTPNAVYTVKIRAKTLSTGSLKIGTVDELVTVDLKQSFDVYTISVKSPRALRFSIYKLNRGGTTDIDYVNVYEEGGITTTQMTQLANNWAVRHLNSADEVVSQINLSGSTFLIEAKNIVGLGDAVINGKLTVTGDMIAGTISADKISGGTITGAAFNTTDGSIGFSITLQHGIITFKHQIFTLGEIHATVIAGTSTVNGFAVGQRPGYVFSLSSRSNLPNNTNSSPVLQIPADSSRENRKLNIYAPGGFRISSDTLDIQDDRVVAKKPLRALDGFMASHEQANEGAKIADAGNLIYSVDKAGSVMIHRFMVRRKDGTWPNNGLAIYEDGRVAVVVNGVWKQL